MHDNVKIYSDDDDEWWWMMNDDDDDEWWWWLILILMLLIVVSWFLQAAESQYGTFISLSLKLGSKGNL